MPNQIPFKKTKMIMSINRVKIKYPEISAMQILVTEGFSKTVHKIVFSVIHQLDLHISRYSIQLYSVIV